MDAAASACVMPRTARRCFGCSGKVFGVHKTGGFLRPPASGFRPPKRARILCTSRAASSPSSTTPRIALERDQLKKAVAAFRGHRAWQHRLPAGAASPSTTPTNAGWTKLFALDYSAMVSGPAARPRPHFRQAPMVPLGGTSNHFRTATLRELGGWDAFNVTEDADLGIRIAQFGGRVAMLDSTTFEEAPTELLGDLRLKQRLRCWPQGTTCRHGWKAHAAGLSRWCGAPGSAASSPFISSSAARSPRLAVQPPALGDVRGLADGPRRARHGTPRACWALSAATRCPDASCHARPAGQSRLARSGALRPHRHALLGAGFPWAAAWRSLGQLVTQPVPLGEDRASASGRQPIHA